MSQLLAREAPSSPDDDATAPTHPREKYGCHRTQRVIPGVTPATDPERWLKRARGRTFSQGKKRRGVVSKPGQQGRGVGMLVLRLELAIM